MTLSEVLAGAQLLSEIPPELARRTVAGLEYDSRRVQPGYRVFCLSGRKADGRAFAAQATENGAIATVSELPAPYGWMDTVDSGDTWAPGSGAGCAHLLRQA